ncbi:MAG TPA: hypothetical protein VJR89_41715 [Polyangiales bacterium]|nr:hypothetical protein [Polyangiales bacterium]
MERFTDPAASWFELDARESTLHSWGARRSAALVLAFTLLFAGLRSVHLDADPTTAFGSRAARELVAEPAAKSHEARNYALFSTYHVNKADDYQFSRAQSPV